MPSKVLAKLIIVGLCALTLAGCVDQRQEDRLAQNEEAVGGGVISGPEDDGVVKLETKTASGVIWTCTGSLVAPNVVVTARHCITNFVDGYWTCDADGNLSSTNGAGQMGAPVDPSSITVRAGTGPTTTVVAKGQSVFSPQVSTICLNDIAFVVLDTELTSLPVVPIRLTTPTLPGEQFRTVGYGLEDLTKDASTKTRHTRSGNTIVQVGPSNLRPNGDAIAPRTFLSQASALCIGDSGGPALSDNGAVIGVFSQFVGTCTAPDVKDIFTQIAPFSDIAMPAFQASGYEPWLEGNSEPGLYGTGGAGSAGGAEATGGALATSETGGASSIDVGGAASATGGETSAPIVYDQGPARGGTCACRTAGVGHRGFGAMLLGCVAMLGLACRKRLVGAAIVRAS